MDVFISCPFSGEFDDVSQAIKDVAESQRLEAYRVDQDNLAVPIAGAIEKKIRESRMVVADLTGGNPNVLHEVGQAQSLGKPLILISQDSPVSAPFNVRGLRVHEYTEGDIAGLRQILQKALSEATSPNETLRAMLVPSSLGHPSRESRFVVATSPLSYRRAMGRSGGYKKMRRTYSDYVGVRGILQAFGLLYGFETLPDLIDPEDYDDCAMAEPMTVYSIASPKANRWTGKLLSQFSERWVPRLDFRPDPASKNLKNVKVSLYSDGVLLHPPGYKINAKGDRYGQDFGVIVRGPNPSHPDHMSVIIAGRSSLGTEAACLAFTDTDAISKIHDRLMGLEIDIEDHKEAFYAVVSLRRAIGDEREEAIANTMLVHQVGAFQSVH